VIGTTVSTEVLPRARPGADHHAAAYSPQSNRLAEAFVGTFKRDYVDGAELGDAESVLTQPGRVGRGLQHQAPHATLGMRSPADYRAEQLTLSSSE